MPTAGDLFANLLQLMSASKCPSCHASVRPGTICPTCKGRQNLRVEPKPIPAVAVPVTPTPSTGRLTDEEIDTILGPFGSIRLSGAPRVIPTIVQPVA